MKTRKELHLEVRSKSGRLIVGGTIKRMGMFEVIPDATIELKGGQEICISTEALEILLKAYIRAYPNSLLCPTSEKSEYLKKIREEISKERQR